MGVFDNHPAVRNYMSEAFECLRKIEADSSRNNKKKILAENMDNEILKKLFLYTYDTSKMFGIGAKSIAKLKDFKKSPKDKFQQRPLFPHLEDKKNIVYTDIFDILDELQKHPYGSSQDVETVLNFLVGCEPEEQYWFTKIILKDLKIGCTAITVNEIFIDLIPVFNVQKGEAYDPDKHIIHGIMWAAERKMDGYRMIAKCTPDGVVLFTENGGQFLGFLEIEEQLKSMYKYLKSPGLIGPEYVLDGELLHVDGTFSSTQKVAFRQGIKNHVVFHVFDIVTLDEWEGRKQTEFGAHVRGSSVAQTLSACDDYCDVELTCIKPVELVGYSDDEDQIKQWLKEALEQGWEGLMIKKDVPFIRKRHSDWLKLKRHETIDLHVIDVVEGTGKNVGKLGAAVVEYKGNTVNVGGGFTLKEREEIWDNPNLILDKIIEVSYMQETHNADGLPSLRHPIFERIRNDK